MLNDHINSQILEPERCHKPPGSTWLRPEKGERKTMLSGALHIQQLHQINHHRKIPKEKAWWLVSYYRNIGLRFVLRRISTGLAICCKPDSIQASPRKKIGYGLNINIETLPASTILAVIMQRQLREFEYESYWFAKHHPSNIMASNTRMATNACMTKLFDLKYST